MLNLFLLCVSVVSIILDKLVPTLTFFTLVWVIYKMCLWSYRERKLTKPK